MSVERLREHLLLRYVVAVGAAVATIAALIPLRFLIEPLPSPPFLLTVMIVAWVAGFGPANIAVVISAVALDYWFVPPLGAVATTWHEIASVISFAVVGIGVAWLTATRRQAEDDRKALLARERASRASAEAANRAKDENLLDNAVKYTPAGGAIQVRVSREGGHGVLRVRDTGVGIARDVLPRIFELFVQGEPGAIRGRSGLGIGLAVVQRLAELHGGTIDAASDGPGRGSTFSLRLRGVAAPAVRTLRVRPVIAPAPRRRIVVAETDPDLRAILRALLETSGHDVSAATDGPEAFAAALRVRPDVMLIDVDLAGFDGYELARRLRMTPEAKSTLLVALTGWGRADDVERARAAGFDHHATKPLDPDALAEILRR